MKIRINHPVLRDFFDQLRFAPTPQKKKQLAASEKLLMILDTERRYPFDFIVYRITGYRPPVQPEQPLISGRDLLLALRVWIAQLSAELRLDASEQDETILTVQQLAERFNVSTKTIRRWQKRGLTGRIYVFQSGRRRLGFAESTVDLFVRDHADLVDKAAKFSLVLPQQKQQIRTLAQELTSKKSFRTQNELLREIARQVGRTRHTVRSVLEEAENQKKHSHDLPRSRGKIASKDASHLYRLSRQNVPIKTLMETFGRSRSSIYRIINQQRAKELFSRKIEFIPSEEFLAPAAEQSILSVSLERILPDKDRVLLSRQQEAELFRRYNYLKFSASQERAKIQRGRPRSDRLNRIESLLSQIDAVNKIIIEANMPLVVSIAGKHLTAGTQMNELVSEGSVALMAAVEKFDYTRGYRFSTYASWAIAKAFARLIPAEAKRPDRAGGADFANLPINLRLEQLPDVAAVEQAQRDLQTIIKNNLDRREQYIILNHYALDPAVIKKKPKTLKQIGEDLDLSKERIRQIELQALHKLRQSLSPEQFDLLTG
ncbi:MAG: sigma-70 family RNA polymerase sigma factor [Phycisphaerae bacterium]|nr:sigma-70 family RNA polymerase sigma factor [Phycisphaerae bacterium]